MALAILTLSSCGNGGGGSEEVASNNVPKLSWDPPTTTVEGSGLTGINSILGYKVYYGTSSGNYTSIVDVGNVTIYTVTGLSVETYYFAVTASNANGESVYSNEVCYNSSATCP